VSVSHDPEYREFAVNNLWRVDLMALLRSEDPLLQQKALEILILLREKYQLNLRLEVPELIELLDSPALRDKSLESLRAISGQDFGLRPELWTQWWDRARARRDTF
jgi:hypothetical protein